MSHSLTTSIATHFEKKKWVNFETVECRLWTLHISFFSRDKHFFFLKFTYKKLYYHNIAFLPSLFSLVKIFWMSVTAPPPQSKPLLRACYTNFTIFLMCKLLNYVSSLEKFWINKLFIKLTENIWVLFLIYPIELTMNKCYLWNQMNKMVDVYVNDVYLNDTV